MVNVLGLRIGLKHRIYPGEGVKEEQEGTKHEHKRKQKHVDHNQEYLVAQYVSPEVTYMGLGQDGSGNLDRGHSIVSGF